VTEAPGPVGRTARDGETRLLLVRHGETGWEAQRRYAGGLSDIGLTTSGRRQARQLSEQVRHWRLDAVVSSPLRRAIETAAPCAKAVGVPLQTVDALREIEFGIAEGRSIDELLTMDEEMVHRFRLDPVAHPFLGGEEPASVARRIDEALREIARRYTGCSVLVVGHNTSLRLGLCELLGLPISRYRQIFPRLENCALTELVLPTGELGPASLLSLNAPGFLGTREHDG